MRITRSEGYYRTGPPVVGKWFIGWTYIVPYGPTQYNSFKKKTASWRPARLWAAKAAAAKHSRYLRNEIAYNGYFSESNLFRQGGELNAYNILESKEINKTVQLLESSIKELS